MSERTNGWMSEWVKHWVTDGLCIGCLVCTWNCKIYLLFYLHKFPGGNCKHILMHSAMAQRQWRGDEGVKRGRQHDQHKCAQHTHTHTIAHWAAYGALASAQAAWHNGDSCKGLCVYPVLLPCLPKVEEFIQSCQLSSLHATHALSLFVTSLFVSSLLHIKCIAWY